MRRTASSLLICGLLCVAASITGPAYASPVSEPPITATPSDPEATNPSRQIVTAPLPSAGLGGLALLSLMMLRRWFRHKL